MRSWKVWGKAGGASGAMMVTGQAARGRAPAWKCGQGQRYNSRFEGRWLSDPECEKGCGDAAPPLLLTFPSGGESLTEEAAVGGPPFGERAGHAGYQRTAGRDRAGH